MSFSHKARGVLTAGLMSLALLVPHASAQAVSPASPAPTSTTAVAVAEDGGAATSVKTTQCSGGFDFWAQKWTNCTGRGQYIYVRAHESISGRWFNYYYCVPAYSKRQPLAIWGQLAWSATQLRSC